MSFLFLIEILLISNDYLQFNIVIKINKFIPYEDNAMTPYISFVFNDDAISMPHRILNMKREYNPREGIKLEEYMDYEDFLEKYIHNYYTYLEYLEIWFRKYNITADIITNKEFIDHFYINCIGIDFEYYQANYSVSYYVDNPGENYYPVSKYLNTSLKTMRYR